MVDMIPDVVPDRAPTRGLWGATPRDGTFDEKKE